MNHRNICSPEHPMPPMPPPGRWIHTDTEEVGEQRDGWPSGDTVKIRCKSCGKTWIEELPQ